MVVICHYFEIIPQTKNAPNFIKLEKLGYQIQTAVKLREKVVASLSKPKTLIETIRSIEEYLPHLFSIKNSLASNSAKYPSNIAFSWSSGLLEETKSGLLGKKSRETFTDASIQFECIMMLWSYGYLLCNYAADMIKQLMSSKEVIATKEIDYNSDEFTKACSVLCKATGVFQYLLNEEIEKHASSLTSNNASLKEMPEITKQAANSMICYCLSIVQVISIHQALQSNQSALSIAQLCVTVYKRMDIARINMNELVHEFQAINSKQTLSEQFRALIAQYRILYRGIALKYMAIDAYSADMVGFSVGYIITANKQLEEMEIFEQLMIKSNPFLRETKRVMTETSLLEEKYNKENQMVFREKIPDHREFTIPDGSIAQRAIPFIPPTLDV